ncbi:uncharacterized protein [Coffea arabica]|uniref:DUF4283 domain-containing protein n=1 Tax=Coffea arabica TaxID=13443 RepID=A0ABM4VZT2_COFAR
MAGLQSPGGGAGSSFAAALQNQPSSSSLSPCKIKTAAQYRGEPTVLFSEEDIAKLSAPFKFAVVGKFSHGRPSLDVIRKSFSAIGFKSNFAVGLLDQRHILIRFCLEEDFLRCWTKGLWSITEFSMRVFKWSTDFTVSSESSRAPVWIALEHLPIHFFDKMSLFSIASTIGNPLQIDTATASLARPSIARICMDLDISKELPVRVWIGTGNHGFWQRVLYENLPLYCPLCSRQGHSSDGCRQNKQRRDGPRPATAAAVAQTQEVRGGAQHSNATPHPALAVLTTVDAQTQDGSGAAAADQEALDGRCDAVHKGKQGQVETAEHRYSDPAKLVDETGPLQVTANPPVLGSIYDDSQIQPALHEKMSPQGSLSDGEELPEEGGDFNAIRTLAEYTGRANQDLGAISDFNTAIFDCHLQELPYSGSSYTWSGVRAGARIWKRLDKVLINQQWLNFLPNTSVQHLNRATSDHTPLLVNLRSADASVPKPFKFQNFWVSSSCFKSTVQSNWELPTQGYGMYRLAFKLKRMQACLRHWSKQHFGNIFQAVRQNEFEVQQKEILFEATPTDEARAELHRAKACLLQSLRVEEDYWHQKARLRWLKDGDSNTRYFHASVREKRSKLAIHRIKDEGGIWMEDEDRIGQAAVCFFQRLLTAEEVSDVDDLLIHIPKLVSANEN